MKLYYKIVLLMAFLSILIFLIGPFCISIDSTPIVIGFCIIIVLALPAIFKFAYKIVKEIQNEINNELKKFSN